MASSIAGCAQQHRLAGHSLPADLPRSSSATTTTTGRASRFAIASCSSAKNVAHRRRSTAMRSPSPSSLSSTSLSGAPLVVARMASRCASRASSRAVGVRASATAWKLGNDAVGENPEWSDDDFISVGLAHCFRKDDDQKLYDVFVVEPIPAGGLECMDNGGVTCYKHVVGTTLGVVLKQDVSLLPEQFAGAQFCEEFDFRCRCASRTWKRDHARSHLMGLLPRNGGVRSDWNFRLVDKRILNQEHVVKDSDNIKQDLSIDVYGRTEGEEEMTAEIGELYNV